MPPWSPSSFRFSRATHKQKVRELAAACVFIKGVTSGRVGVSKLRCNRGLLSRFRSFQKMFPIHPRLFPSSSSHSSPFSPAFPKPGVYTEVGALKTPLRQHCQCIASQQHQKPNPTKWANEKEKKIQSVHREHLCGECTFHQVAPITSNS